MRKLIFALFAFFSFGCTLDEYKAEYNFEQFNNVRIKHKDEHGIIYEYKNVRIDEIAFMASEYCHENNGKKAILQSSQLYKNFSRRATFDCI